MPAIGTQKKELTVLGHSWRAAWMKHMEEFEIIAVKCPHRTSINDPGVQQGTTVNFCGHKHYTPRGLNYNACFHDHCPHVMFWDSLSK